ncbi:MAG: hypothetical protein WA064_00320 [Candidatus Moraniibacteriota bacterium]
MLKKIETIKNFLNNIKLSQKSFRFFVLLILFFSLAIRAYWGLEKQGLHIDGFLSLMRANHASTNISIVEGKIYHKEDLFKNLFFYDSNLKDCLGDIKNLYTKSLENSHTNFYFSLLRLSFLGRSAQTLKSIIETGIALNCLFFVVGFFFFYKLLLLLYEDRFLILATLFCASVAGGAISNTMFLRPYQLQSAMLLMLTFVIVKIIVEKKFTRKMFWTLALSVSLGLLSGYFSIIYIMLLILFILFHHLHHKEREKISYFGASFLTGAILTPILYPRYWVVILLGANHAGEAYTKMTFGYFISHLIPSTQLVYRFVSSYAIYGLSLFLLLVIFNVLFIWAKRQKLEINYLALNIIVIAFLFSVLTILLAPLQAIRYILPVFPLLTLAIPLGIGTFKNDLLKKTTLFIFIILFTLNCFNDKKIKYLYENKVPEIDFLAESDASVCILGVASWRFLEWTPYAKDEQTYLFFQKPDEFLNYIKNHTSTPGCNYAIIDTLYEKDNLEDIKNHIRNNFIVSDSLLTAKDDAVGFEVLKLQLK